ncbi:branched-chain amino acid ABC transporter permease [Noviherbaspirillum suwonense]|jgi:branched-chain amino acid transport system permease protein|uniref:Amino acid/amide ABC transporter membrane protein 1, HAAT family n=1 Tax=Noviherbaspirillum suwonense TaxID=1224511 RepID=A0ABY1Q127_9BURK|nr:branched-chain amino acid ABC transporter permease [Noviherbaspirillum suwonense]SMP56042.1 amino acid/amide ABC transporter membrane protein 1, HAAT family [Noviherbaspirillum suwonense]
MNQLVTILIDGITYASWLFIVALGLTLVFGVLKILNIAHGSFYAVGAYAAASFVGWFGTMQFAPSWSLVAMLLAAVAVAVLVAPLCERALLRPFYGRDEVLLVLVTYALFLILEDVTKLVWGVNPYYVTDPYALFGNVEVGAQSYVGYDFMLVAVAVVVGVAVWWGLNRTRQGKLVLAVIHSEEVASSMGVNVSKVYMLAFGVGIFLAALGGALTAPMISVQPGVSVGVIIVSFAVVIIGGLGSIPGAAIGALIVGLARSLAVHTAPVAELFSVYIVMAVVLMFRPQGLFQRIQARKI